MAEGKFCGRLLPDTSSSEQNNEGLVCVEELSPPNVRVLPNYIARLRHYTEKDCRRICRQMAEIIKISHDNGMAHRNIHMNNWVLDKNVSMPDALRARPSESCSTSLRCFLGSHMSTTGALPFPGNCYGSRVAVCAGNC